MITKSSSLKTKFFVKQLRIVIRMYMNSHHTAIYIFLSKIERYNCEKEETSRKAH